MRFLHSLWCPLCLGVAVVLAMLLSFSSARPSAAAFPSTHKRYVENEEWLPPNDQDIASDETGDLIRYGKELITHTSDYLGPNGIVASMSNGMNCQNCHIDAGRQNFANPFSGAATSYPKYRDRSGRIESLEFRVNECMQRSLNGQALDSEGLEMKAIVAYVRWVGQDVPKGIHPKGLAVGMLPLLDRAADTVKGRQVYTNTCASCHGNDGAGAAAVSGTGYTYPPLWGSHSFNTGAGILRLSALAGFIKNNMPQGATWKAPALSDEEAWDVAAYVSSRQRPQRTFSYDWKNLSKKPFDFPFGPYADSFSEAQHRYGPFRQMMR